MEQEQPDKDFEDLLCTLHLDKMLQLYRNEKNKINQTSRKDFIGLIIDNLMKFAENEHDSYEPLVLSIQDSLEYWKNYSAQCSEDEQDIMSFYTFFDELLYKLQHDRALVLARLKELRNFNYVRSYKHIQDLQQYHEKSI